MSRMPTPLVPVLACALLLAACGDSSEEDAREVPLREQPTVDVEMIGEGVISTEAPEFAAAFTPGGDTLFFTRSSPDRNVLRIMFSVRDSAGWSEPVVAPFSGRRHRDVDPFVTPDGSRLYFSSDRPAPVGAADMNSWWVDREEGGWSEARTAGPPLNSEASDVFVSATRDGTLYFSSRRGGRTRQSPGRAGGGVPRPHRGGARRLARPVRRLPGGRGLERARATPEGDQHRQRRVRAGAAPRRLHPRLHLRAPGRRGGAPRDRSSAGRPVPGGSASRRSL